MGSSEALWRQTRPLVRVGDARRRRRTGASKTTAVTPITTAVNNHVVQPLGRRDDATDDDNARLLDDAASVCNTQTDSQHSHRQGTQVTATKDLNKTTMYKAKAKAEAEAETKCKAYSPLFVYGHMKRKQSLW